MEKLQAFLDKYEAKKVSDFKNEHGELWLIYRLKGINILLITGDELGWEAGWQFNPNSSTLNQTFKMTDEERDLAVASMEGSENA